MKTVDSLKLELYEYAQTLNIIDAHEHFISESEHIKRYLSFYDYLSSYVRCDLASSGADSNLFDSRNEEEAIALFQYIKPYWQYVKNGSYARPVLLSIKKFHDCDDLTEDSIIKIGRDLNAHNNPGHYDEIFNECKIERILNQPLIGEKAFEYKRFCYSANNDINLPDFFAKFPNGSYDDYIDMLDKYLARDVSLGCKHLKFFADVFICSPDEKSAREDFEKIRNDPQLKCSPVLTSTIAHEKLKLCAKHGIVAAIHTGVWGNITRLSPSILFSVMEAYWDVGTIFDIYHMGIPYVRECAFLGKNYPFAYLNLCWSHCVSEQMTKTTINEWLDLVPVNKVFGFGGDVFTLPEQVWGQLHHALQNLSEAFAYRISIGRMDMDYAKYVMKLWLYDNPKRVYKLD